MANHTAFMKLWVGDYISDTGTLNTQRHGAYFLLILEYWKSGCIPKVDEELFLVCKAMTSTAQSDVLFVRDKYFIDGVHKRLDKELLIAKKAYDKRVSAQSKSVESRKANSNAIAKQLAKPLQSSDSDSSSSSSSTSNTKPPKKKNPLAVRPDDVDEQVWNDFILQRKTKFSQTAFTGLINQAAKAGVTVEQALRAAIDRGWQSFNAEWSHGIKGSKGSKAAGQSPWDILVSKIGLVPMNEYPEFDDPLITKALNKAGSWMELCRMTDKQAQFQFRPKFEEAYQSLGGEI